MQPIQRVCERCASAFTIIHARHKRQRFCSVSCAVNARPKGDPAALFWRHVDVRTPDQCWLWIGASGGKGYGCFQLNRRMTPAHRAAYIISHGPIPAGLCVMHSCDNPPCCNPSHLSLGTYADNSADMMRKDRAGRKLSLAHVAAIRADGRMHRLIAADYGVSRAMVSSIKRYTAYRVVA